VVRSGISANDEVVVNGVERAKPGSKVTAKPTRIVAPNPGTSPTPEDLAPPSSSATFATTNP
jgi:hypothetical protein